jgi:hypothetical protein
MEKEKQYWVNIINDTRVYNGSTVILNRLTEHFMKHYEIVLRQPNVIKSVCQCTEDFDINEVSRNPFVYKCTKCGETVL